MAKKKKSKIKSFLKKAAPLAALALGASALGRRGGSPLVGFIPINLNLTIDGLSGFKIFEKYTIPSKFLPASYPETIDFIIIAFGKGTTSNIDTVRNQIIEVVEETLDNDITRNGNALDTQIVEASSDEGTIYPYGGVRQTVIYVYEFVRGTT